MYSNPGVYALLLGSGISRDAKILTGWEITLDIIKKIAAIEGEKPSDFEKWYQEKYKESPDYSNLLKKLNITPTERANLLHPYFEPTSEEKEEGFKSPTPAHKCISHLVKYGYFRVILTTNFDRLLERALEEEGITPTVISTEDAIKGAKPFVHNLCTIIKLHGDYMDSRIKNTAEELAEYAEIFNKYLDRVLDEFGLIICGWSAEYDIALREALYRRKNRRFSTYWTVKDKLCDKALKLSNHLQAEQIPIENANKFFTQLLEKIKGLKDIDKPHPSTLPLAIATTKRYLSEDKYRIKLYDFISQEVQRVYYIFNSERFFEAENNLTKETFQKRLKENKEILAILLGILITLIYFGEGKYSDLIKLSMERLIPKDSTSRVGYSFRRFPLLVLTYSIGMIALANNNYENITALFLKSYFYDDDAKAHIIKIINPSRIFAINLKKMLPNYPEEGTPHTPVSDYLHSYMREIVNTYITNDKKYEEIFDIFEYLSGLIYIDLQNKGASIEDNSSSIGRFAWKCSTPLGRNGFPQSIERFKENGLSQGDKWPLLKAGLFKGSVDRFNKCCEAYEGLIETVSKNWY